MYIDLVQDYGKLLSHLQDNLQSTIHLILSLPPAKYLYRYADARNDKTELPCFDQEPFAFYSKANERTIESIVEEYDAVPSHYSTNRQMMLCFAGAQ